MEIKFRGKTIDGSFVYGDLVRFVDRVCIVQPNEYYNLIEPKYHNHSMGCGLEEAVERVYEGLPSFIEVIEYSIFTGVKDKNKEELYLGDLTNFGNIIFENGCFGLLGGFKNFCPLSEWNLNYIEKL